MELVNLVIIIIMITICLVWALRKRREIETSTVAFSGTENNFPHQEAYEREIMQDHQDLQFVANMFQATIEAMLKKIHMICLIMFAVMGVIVWVGFAQSCCYLLSSYVPFLTIDLPRGKNY